MICSRCHKTPEEHERMKMNEPLEIRIGDRTHGATLSECLEWAEEVRLKNEYITQLEAEIAAWEAKAALFVDQGEEIERLRKELQLEKIKRDIAKGYLRPKDIENYEQDVIDTPEYQALAGE